MQQPLNNSVCYLLKTIYLNYVYHLLKQSFSLLAKVLPLKKTNQWFFEKKSMVFEYFSYKILLIF